MTIADSVENIAALAEGTAEAGELHGAAVTAIEVDPSAERLFLRGYAKALHLERGLVETLHEAVAVLGASCVGLLVRSWS